MTAAPSWRRATPWVIALVALVLAHFLDAWSYHHIVYRQVYDHDWGRALRDVGYWPTWGVVALGFWLHERRATAGGMRVGDVNVGAVNGVDTNTGGLKPAPTKTAGAEARRAWPLIASVTVAGIVAEILKILVRRDRPSLHDGAYGFRPWSVRPLSSSGFGFPSSHAVEAFAAATILSHFFPESRCLWWALAIACGITRILAGAHFVSDVIAGALLGVAIATWLVRRMDRQ